MKCVRNFKSLFQKKNENREYKVKNIIWQQNPKWKNKHLGYSYIESIGNSGCAISSIAGIVNIATGCEFNPLQMNELFKQHNGFYGAIVRWNTLEIIFPRIKFEYSKSFVDQEMDMELVKLPCILAVDYNPDTSVYDRHYVLATDWSFDEQKDIKIIDPYHGDKALLLERYGNKWSLERAIYQVVKYHI